MSHPTEKAANLLPALGLVGGALGLLPGFRLVALRIVFVDELLEARHLGSWQRERKRIKRGYPSQS
jgi:hypothetical protein